MQVVVSFLLLLIFLLSDSPLIFAQPETTCSAIVAAALENTDDLCSTTGRNQVCYGNIMLEVEAQSPEDSMKFDTPGDITALSDIRQLRLSSLDENTGEWGIALMRIQANLPDSLPGENVTLLMFGDVQITNAVAPIQTLQATVTANAVNVRSGPSTAESVVGILSANDTVAANGRNPSGDWLRIVLPESGTGWVFGDLLATSGDRTSLAVAEAGDSFYQPMQAFYFRSGIGDAPCAEAPSSGILIQTPKGQGEITLRVNEVKIKLGSTAYLQAQQGGSMTISVIEGMAQVEAFGVQQTITEGAFATVPVDNVLSAAGPPAPSAAYSMEALSALPLQNLPQVVSVAEPQKPYAFSVGDCVLTTLQAANLRSGPGVSYRVVASTAANQKLIPDGQVMDDEGFTWWRLGRSWIRRDLVEATTVCDQVPIVDASEPLPAIVSPTNATGNSNKYQVYSCETTTGRPLHAGQNVLFFFGLGSRPTLSEAREAYGSQTLVITVDGSPLSIEYGDYTLGPGGYLRPASGRWLATSGTHIVQATWSGGTSKACVVTING